MTSLKKSVLSAAIVALSIGSFAPVVSAKTALTNTSGATVTATESSADNAAAAVLVEYDKEGNITTMSAASAFGMNGAAASASPLGANAVGTDAPYASIDLGSGDMEEEFSSGMYVEFSGMGECYEGMCKPYID